MLTRIFPKTHRRDVESLVGCWLEGFADWLVSVGYARSPTCHHVRRLKLVLERVESIASDANFSVHQLDTIFTSVRTRPRYRATRRAFERFLAARGLLTVAPDVDRFALLLKVYRLTPIAAEALQRIGALYAIEAEIRGLSDREACPLLSHLPLYSAAFSLRHRSATDHFSTFSLA